MYRLMLVEDDRGIAEAIRVHAESWQFEVCVAEDFRDIMGAFARFQPHIVVLDISLPFFDGYHWCAEIRRVSQVPILFLSSASDNLNMVMAMNMGADDFIAKPFDREVLMAKLQAMLRRCYDYVPDRPVLSCRGAFLDTGEQALIWNAKRISLTKNEYRILYCLLENRGRIVSRETLMERLWQTDSFVDENTLTVNVNRLRKKLDSAGLTDYITTKVGAGYMIGAREEG